METKYKPNGNRPCEVRLMVLRETPSGPACDTPDRAAQYWMEAVMTGPDYRTDQEQFVVMFLNTLKKVVGHQVVTIGTLDTVLVHPREVFRAAIVAGAAGIIIAHNHPSENPMPSEADVKITRQLRQAGVILGIELVDSIIVVPGREDGQKFTSLRELGYFHS